VTFSRNIDGYQLRILDFVLREYPGGMFQFLGVVCKHKHTNLTRQVLVMLPVFVVRVCFRLLGLPRNVLNAFIMIRCHLDIGLKSFFRLLLRLGGRNKTTEGECLLELCNDKEISSTIIDVGAGDGVFSKNGGRFHKHGLLILNPLFNLQKSIEIRGLKL